MKGGEGKAGVDCMIILVAAFCSGVKENRKVHFNMCIGLLQECAM